MSKRVQHRSLVLRRSFGPTRFWLRCPKHRSSRAWPATIRLMKLSLTRKEVRILYQCRCQGIPRKLDRRPKGRSLHLKSRQPKLKWLARATRTKRKRVLFGRSVARRSSSISRSGIRLFEPDLFGHSFAVFNLMFILKLFELFSSMKWQMVQSLAP